MAEELLSASEVRDLLHEEILDWGTQKLVASRIGVSPSYLSDILKCRREPGPKVAAYFDLEPVTFYRATPSEHLPDRTVG